MELFRRLSVTRSQLAEFISSPKTIKLFEDLFSVFTSVSNRVELNTLEVGTATNKDDTLTFDFFDIQSGSDALKAVTLTQAVTSTLISFPLSPIDGQRVLISTDTGFSNITWATGTASVVGSPTTVTPETPVTFAYVEEPDTWYRVV